MKGTFIVCISENIHKWTLKATTRISCKMNAKSCILIKDALKNLIFCYFTLFLAPPAARIFFFFFFFFWYLISGHFFYTVLRIYAQRRTSCVGFGFTKTQTTGQTLNKNIFIVTCTCHGHWHITVTITDIRRRYFPFLRLKICYQTVLFYSITFHQTNTMKGTAYPYIQ